jgi:hypothetical protein
MATAKQVALIVNLAIKAGKLRPDQAVEASRSYLNSTPEEARAAIDKLNAVLGFDRGHSPATTRQRSFILDLEQRVLGKWETTHSIKLSYSDADERIQYLKKLEAAQKARPAVSGEVINIFSRRSG